MSSQKSHDGFTKTLTKIVKKKKGAGGMYKNKGQKWAKTLWRRTALPSLVYGN